MKMVIMNLVDGQKKDWKSGQAIMTRSSPNDPNYFIAKESLKGL